MIPYNEALGRNQSRGRVDRPNSSRGITGREGQGAMKVERLRCYLLVGLKGWVEGQRGFAGDEAGTAEWRLIGGGAPVRVQWV